MSIALVPETPEHADALELVLNRAFGPGRFAKTSERVRERGALHRFELSRVALEHDKPVGVCRIYAVRAGETPILFLGPLGVDPDAQHHGCGASLVHECVEACRADGAGAIVLVGAHEFFAPHGFTRIPAGRLTLPGPVDPARFLWCELRTDFCDGVSGSVA